MPSCWRRRATPTVPKDFDDLIRILDGEIRLITPTDPEGKDGRFDPFIAAGEKYYQLTHDYLVPSLRDWLTRKQKETRRGRAELLLADRAAVWNARPENRQLPSLWQWLQIRWLTRRRMDAAAAEDDGKASRYHAVRWLVAAACLIMLVFAGWEGYGRLTAHTLRDRLLTSHYSEMTSSIVKEMPPYRRRPDPSMKRMPRPRRKTTHASNSTPALPCCRWTPGRWSTCTVGCSRGSPKKSS